MTFEEVRAKARKVRALYAELEKEKYGRAWSPQEQMLGFVTDVGELAELVVSKAGMRPIDDVDAKLRHELADCLWSVLILADAYDIDLEKEFTDTMAKLEIRIAEKRQAST
jgi:NTP pyrophosphatase (non-canonical NTP hydrolase)